MKPRRTTVLLAGFEPFGGDRINPAWEVARALDGWTVEPLASFGLAESPGVLGVPEVHGAVETSERTAPRVRAVRLPCVFGQAAGVLERAMAEEHLAAVIVLGLAAGRLDVSMERVAINVDEARIADNAGQQPIGQAVVPGGPAAYFATLPIKAMARHVRAAGLPASVSNTAGTFVCNHVFYRLMHALATQAALAGVRGGFIHLPRFAPHAGQPWLALPRQAQAVRVAIASALAFEHDIAVADGQLH